MIIESLIDISRKPIDSTSTVNEYVERNGVLSHSLSLGDAMTEKLEIIYSAFF